MILKAIFDILFHGDKWNIGYTQQTKADFLQRKGLGELVWLSEENSDQSADPFVITINDITYIFYEFLNFWEGKGKIFRIKNFNFDTREQVFESNAGKIHLSYPYLFSDNGKNYCIPETGEAKEVVLYELDTSGANRLVKLRTLITGAHYLDSSLIKFNNVHWLFTSKLGHPGSLFIFYAQTLESEFHPHPLNPILCDMKSFRSAGNLFVENGVIYRPSQNLERSYGGSLVINKITKLSAKEFESTFFFEIMPLAPYPDGIHTISFEDNLIVIDGKRKLFSWVMIFKKINKKIRYIIRKLTRSFNHRPNK